MTQFHKLGSSTPNIPQCVVTNMILFFGSSILPSYNILSPAPLKVEEPLLVPGPACTITFMTSSFDTVINSSTYLLVRQLLPSPCDN
eukprot:4890379-Ditylum_brightwellii.AAC.1